MSAIASQITSLTIVYSTVYPGADQSKHQSSASLAFVRGIHRGPVNSPHKWPVTRKMFPFDDVIMEINIMTTHGFSVLKTILLMCTETEVLYDTYTLTWKYQQEEKVNFSQIHFTMTWVWRLRTWCPVAEKCSVKSFNWWDFANRHFSYRDPGTLLIRTAKHCCCILTYYGLETSYFVMKLCQQRFR